MKAFPLKHAKISLFSEKSLIILVSVVTLLLQLISFATTWDGAKVYLSDIFPLAPLCFAVAIQATTYFFSNSLRSKITLLKVLALCAAICCSTYYSYIGIYNSVHSPATYLQQRYVQVSQELIRLYTAETAETYADAEEQTNTAASAITAHYTTLLTKRQTLLACEQALEEIKATGTAGLRAPKQANYETYEEYAAAYQAYIESRSHSGSTELGASREQVLSAYGFSSAEELREAKQANEAALYTLTTALGTTETAVEGTASPEDNTADSALAESTEEPTQAEGSTSDFMTEINALRRQLDTAYERLPQGQALNTADITAMNRLFHTAQLCGITLDNSSLLQERLQQCAQVSATKLLADHSELIAALPGQMVTTDTLIPLKSAMDTQIMDALLKINSLLPATEQLSYSDETYQLTDMYLLPIKAFTASDNRMTAFFCLGVAALIDLLSVLFATALRREKPLWKKHLYGQTNVASYQPLIYGALPVGEAPEAEKLQDFLVHFAPSPRTESDGYMLQGALQDLTAYQGLAALLCQINLAKIMPSGTLGLTEDTLLLKARFVFWADEIIYKEREKQ